jgi:hypothetical protein
VDPLPEPAKEHAEEGHAMALEQADASMTVTPRGQCLNNAEGGWRVRCRLSTGLGFGLALADSPAL